MLGKFARQALLLLALPSFVFGVAPTDEYRDADEAQSSYLSNHNMVHLLPFTCLYVMNL